MYLDRGSAGVEWYELVIPAAVLFGVGGMPLFLSPLLFFVKIGWFAVAKEKIRSVALLFVRGLVGPFLFFIPSLVVAAVVVGRSILTLDETDWVSVFGIVYFPDSSSL